MKRSVLLLFMAFCGIAFLCGYSFSQLKRREIELLQCETDLRDMGRITDSCIEDLQTCESMTDLAEAIEASEVQFGPDSPATKLLQRADDVYSRKEGVR